jgi:predicted nucleic acid-binding protein
VTALDGHLSLYLDANVLIYAVEAIQPYATLLAPVFQKIDAGELSATTSELTLAEVLVKPLRDRQHQLRLVYEEMLSGTGTLHVVPIDRTILRQAASLRASSAMRLPDAVHAATALEHGCTAVLTNDARLNASGITTVLIADLAGPPS